MILFVRKSLSSKALIILQNLYLFSDSRNHYLWDNIINLRRLFSLTHFCFCCHHCYWCNRQAPGIRRYFFFQFRYTFWLLSNSSAWWRQISWEIWCRIWKLFWPTIMAWLHEQRFMKFVHVVVDCRHACGWPDQCGRDRAKSSVWREM